MTEKHEKIRTLKKLIRNNNNKPKKIKKENIKVGVYSKLPNYTTCQTLNDVLIC
jgi:hypothetical protein